MELAGVSYVGRYKSRALEIVLIHRTVRVFLPDPITHATCFVPLMAGTPQGRPSCIQIGAH